jgi:apolipoprotein N-acyltransferase
MSDFARGPADQPLLQAKGYQIAPYICYEVVYPEFAASLAARSDLLLTISNDTWFGTSIGPLQHLQMAQMRALEAGRWMIRATNNGVTALINPFGRSPRRSRSSSAACCMAKWCRCTADALPAMAFVAAGDCLCIAAGLGAAGRADCQDRLIASQGPCGPAPTGSPRPSGCMDLWGGFTREGPAVQYR